jgi:cell division protein FtsA
MNSSNKIIAALDLGSDKTICLIGYINNAGQICVKGIGHQKSMGIMNGIIIDAKAAIQSIISAISMAEKMAGYNIEQVVVNISGQHINSTAVKAQANINGRTIRQADISNLAKNIKKAFKTKGKEIVHLIVLDYIIDGNEGIKNPRNIIADILEANVHTITTNANNIKNIKQCITQTPIAIK